MLTTCASDASNERRYLELLKNALLNTLHRQRVRPPNAEDLARMGELKERLRTRLGASDSPSGSVLESPAQDLYYYLEHMRQSRAVHTMATREALDHLEKCVRVLAADGVAGDFLEAGVWRGGVGVLLKAVLRVLGDGQRTVYLADSFSGLPPPTESTPFPDRVAYYLLEQVSSLAVSANEVRTIFRRYQLYDERVRLLEGWFSDTLTTCPASALALLRLDADFYDSTWTALECLYDRVAVGGFIIVDDYGLPLGCRDAVDRFRAMRGIRTELVWVDGQTVAWRKEAR